MRLPDGMRQVLAGLLGAGMFLAAYFALALVWWLALCLALAVYGAALLLISRKPPLEEIHLAARVTAADIAKATDALGEAERRLTAAAERAPERDAAVMRDMARHVASIRRSVSNDPEDYRAARRFIGFYLPGIVQSVEGYAALAAQRGTDTAERLDALSARLQDFKGVVARIDAACLENDLQALELEVNVLSRQLDRVPGVRVPQ